MTARDRLNAALAIILEAGHIPRCAHNGDAVSDDPTERARAARRCTGCPILEPCREVGIEERATWGVYGGIDRSPSRRAPGRPRTTAS